MTLQCPANFLHFLQSENIGSPDGDPIRENANIKGIIIDETEIKLSAYADDGSFFAIDVQSLQLIFFMCNQFREFSSLKLNLEKSEACWIGKAKGREDKPIDCNWINLCNDKIRILDVYNSYDTDLENIYNFFFND